MCVCVYVYPGMVHNITVTYLIWYKEGDIQEHDGNDIVFMIYSAFSFYIHVNISNSLDEELFFRKSTGFPYTPFHYGVCSYTRPLLYFFSPILP